MAPPPKTDDDKCWLPYWLISGKHTWRYEKRYAWSMLAWAACLAFCIYFLKNDLVSAPYTWAVALTPLLVSIIPIRAFFVFITHADELIRKIQLESIVISFGVGLLYGVTYTLLEAIGREPATASAMLVIMLLVYVIAQIYLAWKYR